MKIPKALNVLCTCSTYIVVGVVRLAKSKNKKTRTFAIAFFFLKRRYNGQARPEHRKKREINRIK